MPTPNSKPIGILGGSFDPIHHGHLRMALESCNHLNLDHVRLIPLKTPVHREPMIANEHQRTAMIKRAISGVNELRLDQRELERQTESYTIETLLSLRTEFADQAISLIVGSDSFSTLDTWKDWQQLLRYSHIVIASRHDESNSELNATLQNLLDSKQTHSISDLHQQTHGLIYNLQIPLLDISSSAIRRHTKQQQSLRYLLPDAVIDYIHSEHLYE